MMTDESRPITVILRRGIRIDFCIPMSRWRLYISRWRGRYIFNHQATHDMRLLIDTPIISGPVIFVYNFTWYWPQRLKLPGIYGTFFWWVFQCSTEDGICRRRGLHWRCTIVLLYLGILNWLRQSSVTHPWYNSWTATNIKQTTMVHRFIQARNIISIISSNILWMITEMTEILCDISLWMKSIQDFCLASSHGFSQYIYINMINDKVKGWLIFTSMQQSRLVRTTQDRDAFLLRLHYVHTTSYCLGLSTNHSKSLLSFSIGLQQAINNFTVIGL